MKLVYSRKVEQWDDRRIVDINQYRRDRRIHLILVGSLIFLAGVVVGIVYQVGLQRNSAAASSVTTTAVAQPPAVLPSTRPYITPDNR